MKIIAELAQGFEGSLKQAKLLLKAAFCSGSDIAKFQLVYADELATSDYKYYDLFKSLEMSDKEWKELYDYSFKLNIELNLDIFGEKSLKLCEKLGLSGVKLHGTDINNIGLLEKVANSKIKNIYLGAGGSYLSEIETALSILKNKKVIIILGFQSYPTLCSDNQISRIKYLKQKLIGKFKNLKIGFADHADPKSKSSITLAASAIGAGALIIEKHLTLGKIMQMEDYESALNPDEFLEFSQSIKDCFLAMGSISNSNDFGMSKSEKDYRKMIRRHVTSSKKLKKGKFLGPQDLILKRTSSRDFIHNIKDVYDKKLLVDISKNEAITKNIIK